LVNLKNKENLLIISKAIQV